ISVSPPPSIDEYLSGRDLRWVQGGRGFYYWWHTYVGGDVYFADIQNPSALHLLTSFNLIGAYGSVRSSGDDILAIGCAIIGDCGIPVHVSVASGAPGPVTELAAAAGPIPDLERLFDLGFSPSGSMLALVDGGAVHVRTLAAGVLGPDTAL